MKNESGQRVVKKRAYKPKETVSGFLRKNESGGFYIMLPIITVSEGNSSEHWTKKAKRHKAQKRAVAIVLNLIKVKLPCVLEFTRHAPRKLDAADNLPMSMKWVIDAACESITGIKKAGMADNNELIKIKTSQCQSKEYGISIDIRPANP